MNASKSNRGFRIPLRLVNEAQRQGIALPDLQSMVARSARITHPDGNRRFHDFLFMVQGDRVIAFKKMTPENTAKPVYRCEVCKDKGRIPVFDECEHCDGVGGDCQHCDDGLVASSIPCVDCAAKQSTMVRNAVNGRGRGRI